jgi:hypothetical protein
VAQVKFNAAVSGPDFGYVYVLSYPGSNKLKIGHSLDPFNRAKDIGGTKAPENPHVEAFFWCSERREDVERGAHRLAHSSRHNGEWFDISIDRALDVIRDAAINARVEVQLVYDLSETEKKIKAQQEVDVELARLDADQKAKRLEEVDRQGALRKAVVEKQERDFKPEPEADRLERVRVWKLNEVGRLQERYETALAMPNTVEQPVWKKR